MKKDVYVIVRTHNRPKAFSNCISSINSQTVKAKIIIISDDPTDNYINDYLNIGTIFRPVTKKARWWIRHHNPMNDYFNQVVTIIPDGHFIYYLDDDDEMVDPTWIETIIEHDTPLLIFDLGNPMVTSSLEKKLSGGK